MYCYQFLCTKKPSKINDNDNKGTDRNERKKLKE